MWDTVVTNSTHLSHDLPCPRCGHGTHTFLACSASCDCEPVLMPGMAYAPRSRRECSADSYGWSSTLVARRSSIAR